LTIKVGPSANSRYTLEERNAGAALVIDHMGGTRQVITYKDGLISQKQQFFVDVPMRKDGKTVTKSLDLLAVVLTTTERSGRVEFFLPSSDATVVTAKLNPFCKMDIYGESLYIPEGTETENIPKMFRVVQKSGRLYVGALIKTAEGAEMKMVDCQPLVLNNN
jgi:hypothetical protein